VPEQSRTRAYPGALPVLAATCATCGGFCCLLGETHAFLDVPTLRRYMQQNGTEDVREVEAAYAGYLPRESYENSCVYHTETGCALPPEMRSDVSVRFSCGELDAVLERYYEDGRRRFFLASMDEDQVLRYRFVDTEDPSIPATGD
jgi:hypothetical protein